MNKITVVNDIISWHNLKKGIDINFSSKSADFCVNKIVLDINCSTDILIDYEFNEVTKLDMYFNIHENIVVNLYEIKTGRDIKVKESYSVGEDSVLNVFKINGCDNVREVTKINLDGESAGINYYNRTLSVGCEKYDMVINHGCANTFSLIDNKGINTCDGSIIFNVTSIVANGIKNTKVIQNNQIVTFNDNKCAINPNLIIDENEVEASHSAHIGTFDYSELFYLIRLGIRQNTALKLLVKGMFTNSIDINKISKNKINYILKRFRG